MGLIYHYIQNHPPQDDITNTLVFTACFVYDRWKQYASLTLRSRGGTGSLLGRVALLQGFGSWISFKGGFWFFRTNMFMQHSWLENGP